MTSPSGSDPHRLHDSTHHHTAEEERRIRDAALDDTIADSFPASDPPSTDPNPDDHDASRLRQPHGDAGAEGD